MKTTAIAFAAGLALTAGAVGLPQAAEAGKRGHFGVSSAGFSLYIGRGHYSPYYERRHYYRRYYRYRRPAPSYRTRPSRCEHWSRRCAANWGYGNNNWRGCMRYHGCQ